MSHVIHLPELIIAPPLSGCTTLQHDHRTSPGVIDIDYRFPRLKGLPLSVRLTAIREHLFTTVDEPFICVPSLPWPDLISRVTALVIIPHVSWAKRFADIGAGHRIAAIAWRDEVIRHHALIPHIPVFTALDAVPVIRNMIHISQSA